jgi:glycosyltransferase involved in cell wall biosynthesis
MNTDARYSGNSLLPDYGSGEPIDYSIIVPAYNEAEWLPRCLQTLARAMARFDLRGEVIVVDNNSSDNTATIAREAGARVVFEPVNQIARARNTGARQARGANLIFVDADSLLPSGLLSQAVGNLQRGNICGGGARLTFDGPTHKTGELILGLFNHLAKRLRLAAGCFVYCKRRAFNAVGGFDERLYASEELALSKQLKRWGILNGYGFTIIDAPPIKTSSRKLDHPVRLAAALFTGLLFPFAIYSKTLCWYWYRRP